MEPTQRHVGLAGLMVALLACSNPAQLPCLSSPPSVTGKTAVVPQVGALCQPGRVITAGPGSTAGAVCSPWPDLTPAR